MFKLMAGPLTDTPAEVDGSLRRSPTTTACRMPPDTRRTLTIRKAPSIKKPLGDIMRWFWAACTATFLLQGVAMAADPTGEWRVANGNANIRIDNCNGALWGVISWEREPGGVDAQNPDPAERKRPTLGMPILLDMKPTRPGLWQGEVYNAENGKTYDSKISLASADVLRIRAACWGSFAAARTGPGSRPGTPRRRGRRQLLRPLRATANRRPFRAPAQEPRGLPIRAG